VIFAEIVFTTNLTQQLGVGLKRNVAIIKHLLHVYVSFLQHLKTSHPRSIFFCKVQHIDNQSDFMQPAIWHALCCWVRTEEVA
jgi:hypothetical protein